MKKSIEISKEILAEYGILDTQVFKVLGRHLYWDEYIRMANRNFKHHESLDPKIKTIGDEFYGRQQ